MKSARPSKKAKSRKKPTAPDREERAIKLKGNITWVYLTGEYKDQFERFQVTRAFLQDDNELVIDCNCAELGDDPYIYTITLFRQDDLLFSGSYSVGKLKDKVSDRCLCRLYSNGNRYAFCGSWDQAGGTEQWFGELYPVEFFDDEEQGS